MELLKLLIFSCFLLALIFIYLLDLINYYKIYLLFFAQPCKLKTVKTGLVKLAGTLESLPQDPDLSPPTDCVWWQKREINNNYQPWKVVKKANNIPLKLNDGTGICYIFPGNAEITCKHNFEWQETKTSHTHFYQAALLKEGDYLYVIGQLNTMNLHGQDFTKLEDMFGEIIIKDLKKEQKNTIYYLTASSGIPYILSVEKEPILTTSTKENLIIKCILNIVGILFFTAILFFIFIF